MKSNITPSVKKLNSVSDVLDFLYTTPRQQSMWLGVMSDEEHTYLMSYWTRFFGEAAPANNKEGAWCDCFMAAFLEYDLPELT